MRNIIVWGLVSGILAGCNLTQTANAPTNPENNIIVTSASEIDLTVTQTTGIDVFEGSTYTDEIVGFSFVYPEGWWLYSGASEDAYMYAITITSYEPAEGGRGGGIPSDETKIDIYVDRTEPKTLDSAYEQMQATVDEGMTRIIEQEELTLANGLPALFTRVNGIMGGEADTYNVIVNGYMIGISGFGDRQIIRQIADSIQPID